MSRKIDIRLKDSPPNANSASPKSTGGDGSRTRYAFTIAILASVLAAAFIYYQLLGQSTQSADQRLSIETRTTEQVYEQAAAIETDVLRLRALRNFASAYPDAPQAEQSRALIDALEQDEHAAWRAASEVFYNVTAKRDQKQAALDAFAQHWDGGSYRDDMVKIAEQIDLQAPTPRALNETTGAVPGLAGSDIKLPKARSTASRAMDTLQSEAIQSDDLAGGFTSAPRQEFPMAATLPLKAAQPEPVIVEATVKRRVKPSYPSRAQRKGVEAVVTISMDIGADGKVKEARVVKAASGDYASDFGRAALRAARRTRFNPKLIDGVPSPTNGYTQPYRFTITE